MNARSQEYYPVPNILMQVVPPHRIELAQLDLDHVSIEYGVTFCHLKVRFHYCG